MEKDLAKFDEMIKRIFEPQLLPEYSLLETWTSMQSLIVVSAIDEHYNILLDHAELKQVKNIQELHALLMRKNS